VDPQSSRPHDIWLSNCCVFLRIMRLIIIDLFYNAEFHYSHGDKYAHMALFHNAHMQVLPPLLLASPMVLDDVWCQMCWKWDQTQWLRACWLWCAHLFTWARCWSGVHCLLTSRSHQASRRLCKYHRTCGDLQQQYLGHSVQYIMEFHKQSSSVQTARIWREHR
jgi:hypothetical protein